MGRYERFYCKVCFFFQLCEFFSEKLIHKESKIIKLSEKIQKLHKLLQKSEDRNKRYETKVNHKFYFKFSE